MRKSPRLTLTARQLVVYVAILRHWRDNTIGPTLRELAAATGIGNTNGVRGHLRALRAKGWIVPAKNGRSRRIVPTDLVQTVRTEAGALLWVLRGEPE